MSDTLTPTELQALQFLRDHGAHTMPREIEDEGQIAAIMVFGDLKRRGLVIQLIGESTLTYRLTPRGLLCARTPEAAA